MENTDKLVPYTADDRKKLADGQSAVRSKLTPFVLGLVITAVFWRTFTHPWLRLGIGVIGVLYIFALVVLALRLRAFHQDLQGGQKVLRAGVVEECERPSDDDLDDRHPERRFYLKVNQREIPVSAEEFARFAKGDPIYVMLGPNSLHPLGVAKITD